MPGSPYDHPGHRDLCHEDPAAADALEQWYRDCGRHLDRRDASKREDSRPVRDVDV